MALKKHISSNLYNVALKPVGNNFGKNVLTNPGKVMQIGTYIRATAASRILSAIVSACIHPSW